ncbi:MAG: hypothetical protein Q4B89_08445 [Lachnospiraceae bacterium]|nr:hypothetical protein [Lachnospiraceae bacterium]
MEKEYKRFIHKMVDEISNEDYLKKIYTIVHGMFIREKRQIIK